MIKFNINDYIYVQITKEGWKHLEKEVSKEYIKHCIYPYKKEIKGKVWYKLQMHQVFDVLHENCAQHHIHTNILIDIKPKEDENVALNQSDINDIYNSGVPNIK